MVATENGARKGYLLERNGLKVGSQRRGYGARFNVIRPACNPQQAAIQLDGSCLCSPTQPLSKHGLFLNDPIVALFFEFQRELFVASADDTPIHQHVDKIRHDVIQQPLVMRDDQL